MLPTLENKNRPKEQGQVSHVVNQYASLPCQGVCLEYFK